MKTRQDRQESHDFHLPKGEQKQVSDPRRNQAQSHENLGGTGLNYQSKFQNQSIIIEEEEMIEPPETGHETVRELLNKEIFQYMINPKEPQEILEIPTLTIDPSEPNEPIFLAQKLLKIGIENIGAIKILLPDELLPKCALSIAKSPKKLNVIKEKLQNFPKGKVISFI